MKEKKRFRDTDLCKIIIVLIEIALMVGFVWLCVDVWNNFFSSASADSVVGYVLCKDGDYVNIREKPSRKSESIGMYEVGFEVELDGKKKNGYLHCVNLPLEMSDGWIHAGYVVYDEPEYLNENATIVSKGRLAARKYVNGKRTRWLKPLATVKVYYWSDEWCITNCGYVQSQYLELEGN